MIPGKRHQQALVMAQSIKFLVHKHEDLSLDPYLVFTQKDISCGIYLQ